MSPTIKSEIATALCTEHYSEFVAVSNCYYTYFQITRKAVDVQLKHFTELKKRITIE